MGYRDGSSSNTSQRSHLWRWVAAGGLFLTLWMGAREAQASMSMQVTLAELVAESELVSVARTVSRFSHFDAHGRIVTDVELQIEHVEKGHVTPGETVVVRRLGGVVGEIGMLVVGEPVFVEGERQLLFTRRDRDTWRTVGMSQGRMRVFEAAGEVWAHPGGEGLTLFARDGNGRLKRAGFDSAVRLQRLLEQIRSLVTEAERR